MRGHAFIVWAAPLPPLRPRPASSVGWCSTHLLGPLHRNYAKALDNLFAFAGRSAAHLMEFRASMDLHAPSTLNVRLSTICKLVSEARTNGLLESGEPPKRLQGTRHHAQEEQVEAREWSGRTRFRIDGFEIRKHPSRANVSQRPVVNQFYFRPSLVAKQGRRRLYSGSPELRHTCSPAPFSRYAAWGVPSNRFTISNGGIISCVPRQLMSARASAHRRPIHGAMGEQ